jgi:hypothetical protein
MTTTQYGGLNSPALSPHPLTTSVDNGPFGLLGGSPRTGEMASDQDFDEWR